MSQIQGKWIEDGAITTSKLADGAVTAAKIATLGNMVIDQTNNAPAIDVTMTGQAAPALNIFKDADASRFPVINIDSSSQSSSITINNAMNESQGITINMLSSSQTNGIAISGPVGVGWLTTGLSITNFSTNISTDGTSIFPSVNSDFISPYYNPAVTVTSDLEVSAELNSSIVYTRVENTGTGSGTGSELDVIVGDTTVGMKYALGMGARPMVGSFSDEDLSIVRNSTTAILITTDGDGNPLLDVAAGCPTTLLKDTTATGNLTVTQDLASGTVYNILQNIGSGPNTATELNLITTDATSGIKNINDFGLITKMGTFSDHDLKIQRNSSDAMTITYDGLNPYLNIQCSTTLLNDATVTGNLEVLDSVIVDGPGSSKVSISGGGGHIAERNYIDSMTGDLYLRAQPATAINSCQISLDGTNITLAAVGTVTADVGDHFEVYGDATIGNNVKIGGPDFRVERTLNSASVAGMIRNDGVGNATKAEMKVILGDATTGIRDTSGSFRAIGTFSDHDYRLIRNGSSAVYITTDGDGNPQMDVNCITTNLNDATVNGNLDVYGLAWLNDATINGNLDTGTVWAVDATVNNNLSVGNNTELYHLTANDATFVDSNYITGVMDSTAFIYVGWSEGLRITSPKTKLSGEFSCNNATTQSSYYSGGAAWPVGTNTNSWGADSSADFASLVTLVNNIRTALVNNGIMY